MKSETVIRIVTSVLAIFAFMYAVLWGITISLGVGLLGWLVWTLFRYYS